MPQRWIAFLRIVVGLFFIAQGLNKLNWYSSSELLRTSLDRYSQNANPLSAWYQQHVAYPGVEAWSRMIPTGEILIGIALIVGLLTQATLIVAIALVVNFHLANGALFTTAFFTNPYAFLLLSCLLFLAFNRAGSSFALDAKRKKNKPQRKG